MHRYLEAPKDRRAKDYLKMVAEHRAEAERNEGLPPGRRRWSDPSAAPRWQAWSSGPPGEDGCGDYMRWASKRDQRREHEHEGAVPPQTDGEEVF